jgi:hypothetical protein
MNAFRIFNDQFAPCVIRLASDIHLHMWKMNKNAIGSEIAAGIYKACHHEYHESYQGREWTHGRLSQMCIEELSRITNQNEKEIISVNLDIINRSVNEFYCNSTYSFDERLGFHIGSEFLAAFEFFLIDSLVKEKFPDIYNVLQSWHWVSIHTGVEIEHFKNAIESYEKAKGYFDLQYVSVGIEKFAHIQSEFFNTVQKCLHSNKTLEIC